MLVILFFHLIYLSLINIIRPACELIVLFGEGVESAHPSAASSGICSNNRSPSGKTQHNYYHTHTRWHLIKTNSNKTQHLSMCNTHTVRWMTCRNILCIIISIVSLSVRIVGIHHPRTSALRRIPYLPNCLICKLGTNADMNRTEIYTPRCGSTRK